MGASAASKGVNRQQRRVPEWIEWSGAGVTYTCIVAAYKKLYIYIYIYIYRFIDVYIIHIYTQIVPRERHIDQIVPSCAVI
mgnify:CR=1 FL=1